MTAGRDRTPRVLALVGLRCSGKSTVGRALAERVGARFIDLDERVAAAGGLASAGAVLEQRGLEGFRDLEESVLAELLGDPPAGVTAAEESRRGDLQAAELGGKTVLATGGGTVERAASRERLRRLTRVVWLRAPLDELRARMAADTDTERPPIPTGDEEEFISLERRRAPHFADLADGVVEVSGRSPEDLAAELDAAW